MKIVKLVVRSKRWTSCFLFRANTCKTGFECVCCVTTRDVFSAKTLETNCLTGFDKKMSFSWPIKNVLFMSIHAELEDILKSNSPRRLSFHKTSGEANFLFRTKWLEVFLEKSFSLEAFPLKWTKKLCEMCFPVSGILKKVCLYDHHEIHTRTYERCHWSQMSISKYNSALVYSSLCIVGENDKFLKSRMPSHYIFLFSSSKVWINSFAVEWLISKYMVCITQYVERKSFSQKSSRWQ